MSADRAVLIGLFAGLAGCGTLVDGDYPGEVLYEIEGQVYVEDFDIEGEVGVALLWTTDAGANTGSQAVVVKTSFPARYTIQIYEPPNEESIVPFFGDERIEAAVGDIILYEDVDGNGRWDREYELIVGGAFDASLIWIDEVDEEALGAATPVAPDVPDEEYWIPEEGFNLVYRQAPFTCVTPWEQWLEPAFDRRADLEVSYYFPAAFDWNCDGVSDWIDPGDPDDWFENECDPEAFQAECVYYQEVVDVVIAQPGSEEFFIDEQQQFLEDDPYWADCLFAVCPDTMEQFLSLN